MLLGNVHHGPALLLAEHHARGVAGIGNEDCPGMLVDQRLDAAAVGIVIALLRRGGDGADGSAVMRINVS